MMSKLLKNTIGLILMIMTLLPSKGWGQFFEPSTGQIVAQVDTEKISSDLIRALIRENVTREKEVRKVLDLIIEDILLSKEARSLGLDKAPLVRTRIAREMDHINVSFLLKWRNQGMTLKDIQKKYNAMSNELFRSYVDKEKIKYMEIELVKALADTRGAPEKRKEVVLARVDDTDINLDDVLDIFPSYKEQSLIESYQTIGKEVILNAARMKLIKKEFDALRSKYPTVEEYIQSVTRNVLANAVRAYYVNSYSRFYESETSHELIKFAPPKPDEADLREYYEQNRDKFKVAEFIKARHVMVEDKEQFNEIFEKIKSGKIKDDKDFKKIIRQYSVAEDVEKDGDLGTIFNPILYPEQKLPSIIPWDMGKLTLFNLKKGRFSPPFKSEKGYHILYVYDRKDTIAPLENEWTRQTFLRYWRGEERKKGLSMSLDRLKKESTIIIHRDALATLERTIK